MIAELAGHELIGMEGPRTTNEWQLASGRWRFERRPRFIVNTVDAALAAAEAGVGIANLLSYQVAAAVDAVEAAVRAEVPEVGPMYVEPDLRRPASVEPDPSRRVS